MIRHYSFDSPCMIHPIFTLYSFNWFTITQATPKSTPAPPADKSQKKAICKALLNLARSNDNTPNDHAPPRRPSIASDWKGKGKGKDKGRGGRKGGRGKNKNQDGGSSSKDLGAKKRDQKRQGKSDGKKQGQGDRKKNRIDKYQNLRAKEKRDRRNRRNKRDVAGI